MNGYNFGLQLWDGEKWHGPHWKSNHMHKLIETAKSVMHEINIDPSAYYYLGIDEASGVRIIDKNGFARWGGDFTGPFKNQVVIE